MAKTQREQTRGKLLLIQFLYLFNTEHYDLEYSCWYNILVAVAAVS